MNEAALHVAAQKIRKILAMQSISDREKIFLIRQWCDENSIDIPIGSDEEYDNWRESRGLSRICKSERGRR